MLRNLCKFPFLYFLNSYMKDHYRSDYENEISSRPEGETDQEDQNVKFLDMYSTIYSMRQELEEVRKPSGTKENPARTCRDLFYGHPHLKDG